MMRAAFLLPVLLLGGCAMSEVTVLPNAADEAQGSVQIYDSKTGQEVALIDKPGMTASVSGKSSSIKAAASSGEGQFADVTGQLPEQPKHFTLYFKEGSVDPTPETAPLLDSVFAEIKRRPGPDLNITGHTDTVGSLEDNDALSLRRAAEITAWLFSLGLDKTIVRVAGRGERELFEKTPDNTESAANRRVEVIVR